MSGADRPEPSPLTKLYRVYFARANLGFALTSPQKGWLHVNPHFCEMLGYSAEELKQVTWADLTHPDDLQADVSQFARRRDRVLRARQAIHPKRRPRCSDPPDRRLRARPGGPARCRAPDPDRSERSSRHGRGTQVERGTLPTADQRP
ncbi:PAS domain S-box protein [Thiocapsa bogorovii]|uniref:PAS domain S-box protein n=1 Tax=Thiocapsa bogorovii TaxID=521689 RepID=UPI0038CD5855